MDSRGGGWVAVVTAVVAVVLTLWAVGCGYPSPPPNDTPDPSSSPVGSAVDTEEGCLWALIVAAANDLPVAGVLPECDGLTDAQQLAVANLLAGATRNLQ